MSDNDIENDIRPTANMAGLRTVVDLTGDADDERLPTSTPREVIDLSTPPPQSTMIANDEDEEDYESDDDGYDYTQASIARLSGSVIQLPNNSAPRFPSSVFADETAANTVGSGFDDYMDNDLEYDDQDRYSVHPSTDEEDNLSDHDKDDDSTCSDIAGQDHFDEEGSYCSGRSLSSDFGDDLSDAELDQDEMVTDASDESGPENGPMADPFPDDESSDEDGKSFLCLQAIAAC